MFHTGLNMRRTIVKAMNNVFLVFCAFSSTQRKMGQDGEKMRCMGFGKCIFFFFQTVRPTLSDGFICFADYSFISLMSWGRLRIVWRWSWRVPCGLGCVRLHACRDLSWTGLDWLVDWTSAAGGWSVSFHLSDTWPWDTETREMVLIDRRLC